MSKDGNQKSNQKPNQETAAFDPIKQGKPKSVKQTVVKTKKLANSKVGKWIIKLITPIFCPLIIIIVIVSLLAFIYYMPGSMVGKLKEMIRDINDQVQTLFTTEADAFTNKDDVIKFAQYIKDMQYDLVGNGFIRANVLTEATTPESDPDSETYKDKYGIKYWKTDDPNGEVPHTANQIADFEPGVDYSLIRAYLLSDYRMSVLKNDEVNFNKDRFPGLVNIYGGVNTAWSKGLIKLYAVKLGKDDLPEDFSGWWDNAKVDSGGKRLTLTVGSGFFNRPMTFELDGWTGRYGLSLEFLLSLHLGTMAPDLASAILQNFNTEVQVYCEKIKDAEVHSKYVDFREDIFDTTDADENMNEEITIESINEALQKNEKFLVKEAVDGRLLEWFNELQFGKDKCQWLLLHTGLSSPKGCVYTELGYKPLYYSNDGYNNSLTNPNGYGVNVNDLPQIGIRKNDKTTDEWESTKEHTWETLAVVDPTQSHENTVYAGANELGMNGDDLLSRFKDIEPDEWSDDAANWKAIDCNEGYKIYRHYIDDEAQIKMIWDEENGTAKVVDDSNNDINVEDVVVNIKSCMFKVYSDSKINGNNTKTVKEFYCNHKNPDANNHYKINYDLNASDANVIDRFSVIKVNEDKSEEEIAVSKKGNEITFKSEVSGDRKASRITITISYNPSNQTVSFDANINNVGAASSSTTLPKDSWSVTQLNSNNVERRLEKVYYGGIIVRDKVTGEFSSGTRDPNATRCSYDPELKRCCPICERYVKNVVQVLAAIQDTDYTYYQPFIARVVGSWFRDTYFIVPKDLSDEVLYDSNNKPTNHTYRDPLRQYYIDDLGLTKDDIPRAAYGDKGSYVMVDEEYMAATGEYWTKYEMKEGSEDEYQLYYLHPNGLLTGTRDDGSDDTQPEKMEDWLAREHDGKTYATQEEAEEDGHVFIKKAITMTIQEVIDKTAKGEGEEDGRDLEKSPYLDEKYLWSAYTLSTGGTSGWVEVTSQDDSRIETINKMIGDEGVGRFYYQIKSQKSIEQVEDAIRGETNPEIKNLFRYRKYYIYNGAANRAELIQKDRDRVDELIKMYWGKDGNYEASRNKAILNLAKNGRYAIRVGYRLLLKPNGTELSNTANEYFEKDSETRNRQLREQWLEYQLDVYYKSKKGTIPENAEEIGFELDELLEFGRDTDTRLDVNGVFKTVKFLDPEIYPIDQSDIRYTLDPRDKELISTVNITKSSLDAFAILENTHTLDAEYQYRDFKELVTELNYFDKEDLSESFHDMFTWAAPEYKGEWPIPLVDKTELEYGNLIQSQTSIDFLIKVYEKLVEKEKSYNTDNPEDPTTPETPETPENPETPEDENTMPNPGELSETEKILELLKSVKSYSPDSNIVSPVTGKILSYGKHDRINVYTKEVEEVGFVKIGIMNYGEDKTDSAKSYFTEGMMHGIGLTNQDAKDAATGLNSFYDEYKKHCSGYTVMIDNIDITELESAFTTTEEYDSLCSYRKNDVVALYNSKEEAKYKKIEDLKEAAPSFIPVGSDAYMQIDEKTWVCNDDINGYYVKEGAYLGKASNPTARTHEKFEPNKENVNQTPVNKEELSPEAKEKAIMLEQLYDELSGDENPSYVRIILRDEKLIAIDNIEDFFPRYKEKIENDWALFYWLPFESGGTDNDGCGPESQGSCSEYETAVGIIQWTVLADKGMNNIANQFIPGCLERDPSLCAPLRNYQSWTANNFWEDYNSGTRQFEACLKQICQHDRDAFLAVQMDVAKEQYLQPLLDDYPWLEDRPKCVQGEVMHLRVWGASTSWMSEYENKSDTEIIEKVRYVIANTGSTAGSASGDQTSGRAYNEPQIALEILNGNMSSEDLEEWVRTKDTKYLPFECR